MEHSDKQIPGKAFTVPTTTSSPFIYFLLSLLRKMKANNKNEALKRNVEIIFRKLKLPWTFGNGAKTPLRPMEHEFSPSKVSKSLCVFWFIPDESHIEVVKQLHVQGVMQAQVGKLQLNYFEAMRLCEILNGSLATLDQLTAAWQAGLQICR